VLSDDRAIWIEDTIDAFDRSAFFKRCEGSGAHNQPFRPAMRVEVLVSDRATAVFSPR
jgi:hypothetical protein